MTNPVASNAAAAPPEPGAFRHKRWNEDLREAGATPSGRATAEPIFGADGFGFDDLLDIVNPLQQLPIIGNIYRALTGDAIAPGARMAGATLYGGAIGLAGAVAGMLFEEATGLSMDRTVAGALGQDAPETQAPRALAAASTPLPDTIALAPQPAGPAPRPSDAPVPNLSAAQLDALLLSVNRPEAAAADEPPPAREAAGTGASGSSAAAIEAYAAALKRLEAARGLANR